MAGIKYVQLEPAAFLADFLKMTLEQRGAYTTICFALFDEGGSMSAETEWLSVLCATNPNRFETEIWPIISKKFTVSDGKISHKRVTTELKIAQKHFRARQKAAKERWKKQSNADAKHIHSYANQNQNQNQNQKGNSNQKKKPKPQTHKKFVPPKIEEIIKYIQDNPELSNIDPQDFFKGYSDGGWIDTQGKPVRNWKLKLRTRSKFEAERNPPKICYLCGKPAVKYRTEMGKRQYICNECLPKEPPKRPPPKRKDGELVTRDKAQEQISKLAENMDVG